MKTKEDERKKNVAQEKKFNLWKESKVIIELNKTKAKKGKLWKK